MQAIRLTVFILLQAVSVVACAFAFCCMALMAISVEIEDPMGSDKHDLPLDLICARLLRSRDILVQYGPIVSNKPDEQMDPLEMMDVWTRARLLEVRRARPQCIPCCVSCVTIQH